MTPGTVYHYQTASGLACERRIIVSGEDRVVYETTSPDQGTPSRRALSRKAWKRWTRRAKITEVVPGPAPH